MLRASQKLPEAFRVMKKVTIERIMDESRKARTIFFNERIDCKPGQFIMLWLPAVDEKPFSLSYAGSGKPSAVTFEAKGKFTKALSKSKEGDSLFYRGPFGNPYTYHFSVAHRGNACIVAGGLGFASVSTLADALPKVDIIYGARTKDELIFKERYPQNRMSICTDDGSAGFHGFTTEFLLRRLEERQQAGSKKYGIVYTCGPEQMMVAVAAICAEAGIHCEASLERFMYCGLGLCSSCVCSGRRVCVDGPVFTGTELAAMPDFGKHALLKSGRKVGFEAYIGWRQ